ncbi:hypothetical protein [Anaerosphaera multitolerans]|uniref:Uncharacterized protein n=1 Tax=Anaerosphaera multitolerans TaxID=2487351 RepID=A0A437S7A8_9FIRM|nr:hypothetical protein [Anaerosphaera multitolerans]RVU54935.1 hypothetical protein EF514_04945 [Anaerosphaera multitolerans]
MNRKLLLICFLILLFLPSCSFINSEVDIVKSPTLKKTPLDGKWLVTKSILKDDSKESSFKYKDLINEEVVFAPKGLIIGETYYENVSYKAKRVRSVDYLRENFEIKPEKLNLDTDYLYVIEILRDEKSLYKILKVSEEISYVILEDVFLQITRVSNMISEKEFDDYLNNIKD